MPECIALVDTDFDSIVVGAGVVGLAVARRLAQSGREVLVLERNRAIGEEISSRNSEVLHAGIYYPQDSLKARLCVRGKRLLYDYCARSGIDHRRTGKLIVATGESQLSQLRQLMQRGLANGVEDLVYLDARQAREIEPELHAAGAICSPSTGIIDSHQLLLALLSDLERAGGTLVLASPLLDGRVIARGFEVTVGGAEPVTVSTRQLINCGGLGAQRIARSIQGVPPASIPRRYLSRGCYFSLQGASPFRHLVYPLPSQQGLGIHLTLDLSGCARFGPDAEWVERIDYQVQPGRAGLFADAIRRYWPAVEEHRLIPAYAGIRPKVAAPGEPPADFVIQGPNQTGVPGWCALYGIESPGLTACLAIGELVETLLSD